MANTKSGRVYQSEGPKATYRGADLSQRFNPVVAASSDKQMREYKDRLSQEAQVKGNELARLDSAENMQLQYEQQIAKSQLNVENQREAHALQATQTTDKSNLDLDHAWQNAKMSLEMSHLKAKHQVQNANRQATQSVVGSLLSFGNSYLDFSSKHHTAQEAAKAKAEKEAAEQRQQQDALDWIFGPNSDAAIGKAQAADSAILNADVAGAKATASVAGGDPVLGESLMGATGDRRIAQNAQRGNAFALQAEFPNQLYGAMKGDTPIRGLSGVEYIPSQIRTPEELNDAMRGVARQLALDYGLQNMNLKDVPGVVKSMAGDLNSIRNKLLGDIITSNQDQRYFSAQSTFADATGAGAVDLQYEFQNLSGSYMASGKFGYNQTKANDAAVSDMLQTFVAQGNVDAIEALKLVEAIPGNPGTALGNHPKYGPAINAAKQKAHTQTFADYRMNRENSKYEQDQAYTEFVSELMNAGSDPAAVNQAHTKYEQRLLSLGTPEALAEYQKQLKVPNNYQPRAAADLMEQQNNGQVIDDTVINEMLSSGTITPQEAQTLLKKQGGSSKQVEDRMKQVNSSTIKSMVTGAVRQHVAKSGAGATGAFKDLADQELAPVIADIQGKAQDSLQRYVMENPKATRSEMLEHLQRYFSPNGEGTMYVNGIQVKNGQDGRFEGFEYDYTPNKSARSVDLNTLSQMRPDQINLDDKYLNESDITGLMEYLKTGNMVHISGRAKALMDRKGIGVRSLLRQQAAAYGMDGESLLRGLTPPPRPLPQMNVRPAPGILNKSSIQTRALDGIASHESSAHGHYDAMNTGGSNQGRTAHGSANSADVFGRGLSQMTIGEVMELQKSQVWAAGRYQFIPSTLAERVRVNNIPPNQPFDAATQDWLALDYMKANPQAWVGLNDYGSQGDWAALQQAMNQPLPPPPWHSNPATTTRNAVLSNPQTLQRAMSSNPYIQRILNNPNASATQRRRAMNMLSSAGGDYRSPSLGPGQWTNGSAIPASHADTGAGYVVPGRKDAQGRPLVLSREAANSFEAMILASGGRVKAADVTSAQRSQQKNASLPGASATSLHLRGTAIDIHGTSNAWIRQNGHKYGWHVNDYDGSHGGHFEFRG